MSNTITVEELSELIVRTILHMKETEAAMEQMIAKTGKYIQRFLEMTKPIDNDSPPPQPEVAVSERDRELADHLCDELYYSSAITKLEWARVAEKEIADHLAAERAEHERVKSQLSNEKNNVQHAHEAWQEEKRRRIYYQDIVYSVCNHLDRIFGGKTCCGTIDEPSTEVQALMSSLHKGNRVLELETKLAEKSTQLAATEAKLREADEAAFDDE